MYLTQRLSSTGSRSSQSQPDRDDALLCQVAYGCRSKVCVSLVDGHKGAEVLKARLPPLRDQRGILGSLPQVALQLGKAKSLLSDCVLLLQQPVIEFSRNRLVNEGAEEVSSMNQTWEELWKPFSDAFFL